MTPQILRFAHAADLATRVASDWLERLAQRGGVRPFSVALSGGRIAVPFFSSVVQQCPARESALNQVEFFWADERCLPPTDPESNFAGAKEHLLDPLSIRPEKIHRIQGEIDPSSAARQADAELRRVASSGPDGWPVLDLIFLGMGEDGHVASLFPEGLSEASRETAVYRAVVGPKPPPHRVTMTYPVLTAAREVWVLASGTGKEGALRQSLVAGSRTPLGRVIASREQTVVYTDVQIEVM